METTFREIITTLETFCSDHYKINEFGWGQISDITTKDYNFPLLWLNPTPSNNNGHLFTLNFEMLVIDILDQDNDNKLTVMNETLLIGNDVVKNFWDYEDEYGFTLDEQGVVVSPFMGRFDDFTAGWIFDISIDIENRLNSCSVPKS